MKISKIGYSHKYNDGNYETTDLTLEAFLEENDNPKTVWTELANLADSWHAGKKPQPPQPVTVAPPVVKVEPKPAPKPVDNSEVCPSCGGKKAAKWPVCYNCHMKEKEAQT